MRYVIAIIALLFASFVTAGAQTYDLLIKNGSAYDQSQSLNGAAIDIGIKNGLVTAVAVNINPALATTVYDATGKLVLPGFVNLHAHFQSTAWPPGLGVPVDSTAVSRGYTTMVSAGDAGYQNAAAFKTSASAYKPRTYAFLNISTIGMAAAYPGNELPNIDVCDVCLAANALASNPDFYIGVKVRLGAPNPSLGLEPLNRALQAVAQASTLSGRSFRIMAHIGGLANATMINQIVDLLRPGDIITHTNAFVDIGAPTGFGQNGQCIASAMTAVNKGIILDSGSSVATITSWVDPYSYKICAQAGIVPHTISADDYSAGVLSIADLFGVYRAMNDGANYTPSWAPIAGILASPLTFSALVTKTTRAPALIIGDRAPALLGTLQVGAPGDVVIINSLTAGTYQIWQSPYGFGNPMTLTAPERYGVEKTIIAGAIQ